MEAKRGDHGTTDPAPERTLRRALVGYDGSDGSAAAAAFGLWLAGKAAVQTTLLHVSGSPESPVPAATRREAREHVAQQDREWRRQLDSLRDYAAADAPVDCLIEHGHVAEMLLNVAADLDADLMLLGSTGVGPVRAALLGSVSSQVVEHASCSVMIVREGHPAAPAHVRSIVVGLDGSSESLDALAVAGALAAPLGARLVLCAAYPASVAFAPPTTELRDELMHHAASIVEAARRTLPAEIDAIAELGEGRPRDVLLRASEAHAPALLAVGSRGLGGFTGLLLGSTSRWLANHAPCPVLIGRGRLRRP